MTGQSFAEISTVVSAELQPNGELWVVRRWPSNSMYACYPPRPVPDKVVREVYEARLIRTDEGKHVPRTTVPERFEFTP